jgi:RNA polymerase sigma factor (sigma-70 family)
VTKEKIKREVKLYKPKEGESFPIKVIDDGKGGRILIFRTEEEKEKYRKEQEEREWKEWMEKTNKEYYQKFLKEFKVSPLIEKKIFPPEIIRDLIESKSFLPLYINLVGEETKPRKEREEILALFLDKFIELEAKKYAALYGLDWEDLYQEIQVKLIEVRGTYDPNKPASLLKYYQKIIRNKVIDLVKKEHKPLLSIECIKPQQYSVSIIDSDIEDLRLAMDKLLTLKQKEVIELIFFENLTEKEAANRLGISVNSLKDRLDGAIKKLRKSLRK